MEEYSFKLDRISIKYGNYKEKVYRLHERKYGVESADKILKASTCILKDSIIQKNNPLKNSNSLIVGKVQSGKTSNLEMLSALAFDNGFNLLIIYGGYDNTLLDQCNKRFTSVFNSDYDREEVCILSTLENNVDVLDNQFLDTKINEKTPVIIISLKRPVALEAVNETLAKLNRTKVKAFIIDDEGDQASLNVANDKENEKSATYAEIMKMKSLLNDPIYFSVTATPMANVFQSDISGLKPDSIHLVWPSNGYAGAETFHLVEDYIVDVPTKDIEALDNNCLPKTLEKAIGHFIVSSAIMSKKGQKKTNMIVHSHRTIEEHEAISNQIREHFNDMIYQFDHGYENKTAYPMMKKIHDELFGETLKNEFSFEDIKREIEYIIRSTKVVVRNSNNQEYASKIKHYRNVIHIGGDLLQRGITFENLTTTYFTRWSNNGNMDTNLQRARWFGYRSHYLENCKIFMPQKSKLEFSNLAYIESDLWDQFQMVENGELSIEDIIIDADDTSLKPTRNNAADIKKASFTKKWFNQRKATFDINQIKRNNELFENLIENENRFITHSGRTDGKESAYYVKMSSKKFIEFVKNSEYIFTQSPFNQSDIERVLLEYDLIDLVLMYTDPRKERERTFLDGTISALHQGADSLIKEDVKYRGDAYVIPDSKTPAVHVFSIVPKIDNIRQNNLKQYMYSIHIPHKRVTYVRGGKR